MTNTSPQYKHLTKVIDYVYLSYRLTKSNLQTPPLQTLEEVDTAVNILTTDI